MKTINMTAARQINYTYHVPSVQQCRLLLYFGSGRMDKTAFRRGLAALIYPGQSLTVTPEGEEGNAFLISFQPDILPKSVSNAGTNHPMILPEPTDAYGHYFLSGWTLLEEFPDENSGYHMVSSLLNWFAMFLPEARQESTGSGSKQLVEQAMTVIRNEYANDLTLQTVASQLYVNPSYLSTVFHQVSGTTFRSYLKSVRLQHTCRLLLQTNQMITDIAMQTGFNSAAYLISTFRKEYGVTPNTYRAMHSER